VRTAGDYEGHLVALRTSVPSVLGRLRIERREIA
jgi:hypothetical protein